VLLTGAGVLMRTFVALQTVDLGFNPHNILVARLPFPKGQYKTAAEKQRFFGQLLPKATGGDSESSGGEPGVLKSSV
jgi:putative ABC transport system permease protein